MNFTAIHSQEERKLKKIFLLYWNGMSVPIQLKWKKKMDFYFANVIQLLQLMQLTETELITNERKAFAYIYFIG